MSPEQSSKRASIYEKLALKRSWKAISKDNPLLLLTDELDKNRQIETQLTNLIEEKSERGECKIRMALQSAILVFSTRFAISWRWCRIDPNIWRLR